MKGAERKAASSRKGKKDDATEGKKNKDSDYGEDLNNTKMSKERGRRKFAGRWGGLAKNVFCQGGGVGWREKGVVIPKERTSEAKQGVGRRLIGAAQARKGSVDQKEEGGIGNIQSGLRACSRARLQSPSRTKPPQRRLRR